MKIVYNGYEYDKILAFYGPDARLSNMYSCTFIYERMTFSSVEQALQWKKATMFGDLSLAEEILSTRDPKLAKALGRTVKGFIGPQWDKVKNRIMIDLIICKFGQNTDLMNYLLSTEGYFIAESSVRGTYWGSGFGHDRTETTHPSHYRGKNMLGRILTLTREKLKEKSSVKEVI